MHSMRFVLTLAATGLALSGCAKVGPIAIHNGRAAYNSALTQTSNAQLLNLIVMARYRESSSLLSVASITASVKFSAGASANVGIGPGEDYEGNLVPFSAGVAYEENPTISYLPVESEDYLREMLSPLPLDLVALIINALGDSPEIMRLLVREIAGVRNTDFVLEPDAATDGRFREVAGILASMHRRGAAAWLQTADDGSEFALLLHADDDAEIADVRALHELLGLDAPRIVNGRVAWRIGLGVGLGGTDAGIIELRTRSVQELVRIASASIDVPQEHLDQGVASPTVPHVQENSPIRIRSSKSRPRNALVAIPHRGWWFYIDASDGSSKDTFRIVESLIAARIADSVTGKPAAPVLTIPVSD